MKLRISVNHEVVELVVCILYSGCLYWGSDSSGNPAVCVAVFVWVARGVGTDSAVLKFLRCLFAWRKFQQPPS